MASLSLDYPWAFLLHGSRFITVHVRFFLKAQPRGRNVKHFSNVLQAN